MADIPPTKDVRDDGHLRFFRLLTAEREKSKLGKRNK